MRFVCISDTHGALSQVNVPEGDVLLHSGDLTRRGSREEVEKAIEELSSFPHPVKAFIAGNHDFYFQTLMEEGLETEFRSSLSPDLIYLRDSYVNLAAKSWPRGITRPYITIYGSPWQPWFHDWAFNQKRGPESVKTWSFIPDHTNVLLTHGPPAEILDLCDHGERVGCQDLLDRVNDISGLRLHVFGHIHEAAGLEAKTVKDRNDRSHKLYFCNASIMTRAYQPTQKPWVFDWTPRLGDPYRMEFVNA